MKIQVDFAPAHALSEIQSLRDEYLDSLEHAQEPSLEVLVPGAAFFHIAHQGERCGYFIVHEAEVLIELYLRQRFWVFGEDVFEQILARMQLKRALVKSFDALLFSSCIARHKSLTVKGLLVRDLVLRELPSAPELECRARVASQSDLPAILAVDQEVFRHPERLRAVIDAGYLQLFENEQGLVGFGIVKPVIPGRKHVELGIAVDRPFRMKGHAIYMFRSMIEGCLASGLVPVAGVGVANIASRSMGERTGMVARHRLLELTF